MRRPPLNRHIKHKISHYFIGLLIISILSCFWMRITILWGRLDMGPYGEYFNGSRAVAQMMYSFGVSPIPFLRVAFAAPM